MTNPEHILGMKYVLQIDSCLAAIQLDSLADYDTVIQQLQNFDPEQIPANIQYPSLSRLLELYQDAEDNVFSEDLESFKKFYIYKVSMYVAELTAKTEAERIDEIGERIKQRAAREKNIQDMKELELRAKKLQAGKNLTPEQQELMLLYDISLTTMPEEVQVCIKIKELILAIQDVLSDTTKDLLPVQDAAAQMFEMLDMPGLDCSKLNRDNLSGLSDHMSNIFMLFDCSRITLKDFVTKFDNARKQYLSTYPYTVIDIIDVAEPEVMYFYITCSHLNWWAQSVRKKEELHEDDARSIEYIESRKQDITEQYIELYKKFFNVELSADDLNFAYIGQRLMVMEELVRNVIAPYSLPLNTLKQKDFAFLTQLNNLYHSINDLLRDSGVNYATLSQLPDELLIKLLEHALEIRKLCANSNMKLQRIIELPIAKLHALLDVPGNIQRLDILFNYYFLSKERLLHCDSQQFANLLLQPREAITAFNMHHSTLNAQQLFFELDNMVLQLEERVHALHNSSTLVKLDEIIAAPKLLVKKLKATGLDFYQVRAIYEALVDINYDFTNYYVRQDRNCKFTYDVAAIDLRFPANAAMVHLALNSYAKILKATKPKYDFSAVGEKFSGFPADYVGVTNVAGEDHLVAAICSGDHKSVKENIVGVTDFIKFNNKGYSYYAIAAQLGNGSIMELLRANIIKQTEGIVRQFAKANGFKVGYLNAKNAQGELPLCLAIKQHRIDVAVALIIRGADPKLVGNDAKNALQLALESQQEELVNEILTVSPTVSVKSAFIASRLFGFVVGR